VRNVFGRAGALEARVDGECLVTARGAEGVAGVPVEEVAGFGIDGGCDLLVRGLFLVFGKKTTGKVPCLPSSAGKLKCILPLEKSSPLL
jgi:hypothetical protein